jgi:hypothetical protein
MKVLFIGNSHTYMNDMPELTRRMLEDSTGQPCLVTMLAYSGRSLKLIMGRHFFMSSHIYYTMNTKHNCSLVMLWMH